MIPQLPSKKVCTMYEGKELSQSEKEMVIYNKAIDDCLPRIKYLEGMVEELYQYTEHEEYCLYSQWRSGEPTEGGDYISTYGYGKNEKKFSKNKGEEPECTCGLNDLYTTYKREKEQNGDYTYKIY